LIKTFGKTGTGAKKSLERSPGQTESAVSRVSRAMYFYLTKQIKHIIIFDMQQKKENTLRRTPINNNKSRKQEKEYLHEIVYV
jgi:hypothetical protein